MSKYRIQSHSVKPGKTHSGHANDLLIECDITQVASDPLLRSDSLLYLSVLLSAQVAKDISQYKFQYSKLKESNCNHYVTSYDYIKIIIIFLVFKSPANEC